MATAYPGIGKPLYQATYNGTEPAQPTWPHQPIIAAGEFSESEPLNAAQTTTVSVTFNAAPTAATEIHLASDPTFANYYVLDTLPISGDKFATWTTRERLMGHLRIKNTSTKQINTVFIQEQAAAWG
jgi:hypothetical protein